MQATSEHELLRRLERRAFGTTEEPVQATSEHELLRRLERRAFSLEEGEAACGVEVIDGRLPPR